MLSIKIKLLLWVLLLGIISLQDSYVIAFARRNDYVKKEQSENGAFDLFHTTVNGAKLGCRGNYKDGQQEITDIYVEDDDGHRTIGKEEIKKLTPEGKRTRRSLLNSKSPFRYWPENCMQQIFGSMRYDQFNLFGIQGGANVAGSVESGGFVNIETTGNSATTTANAGGSYSGTVTGVEGGSVATGAGGGLIGTATVIADTEAGHLATSLEGAQGATSHFALTLPDLGSTQYIMNGGGNGNVAVDVTNTEININGNVGGHFDFDIAWRDCLLFGTCDLFVEQSKLTTDLI